MRNAKLRKGNLQKNWCEISVRNWVNC